MADATGVLVLGETLERELSAASSELLAAGRGLADALGEELAIGLLGDSVAGPAQSAVSQGADRVYAVNHPLLAGYQVDLHLAALDALCRETAPRIVLIARTNEGRELAPRLAFRLGVGLAQDCLEVSVDPQSKQLLANRPVYGGNAIAVVSCDHTPQVAAIRPKVYEPLEPDPSREGQVVSFPVELDASQARTRVVETVKEEAAGVKLEDARVVISRRTRTGRAGPVHRVGRPSEVARRSGGGLPRRR